MAARKPNRLEPKFDTRQKDVGDGGEIVKVGKSVQSELQRYHKWIVAFLGFIQPYLVTWFGAWFGSDSEILRKPWAEFYFTVLSQTAPLTISLIIIFVAAVTFWPEGSKDPWGFIMVGTGVAALLLLIAARIGTLFGFTPVPYQEYVSLPIGALGAFLNVLASYFAAYKGVLFLSSVAIAGYGAYASLSHGPALLALYNNHRGKPSDASGADKTKET